MSLLSRIHIFMLAWVAAWRVPGKYKFLFLLNPVDATRYLEFSYLIRFLKDNDLEPSRVLDVSSPLILAYILSARGYEVCKTDIDPWEGKFFRVDGPVRFKREDATSLSFPDGTFDLVYSISVIEHIYERYSHAIREMIRVAKPGGLIYITFPVAGDTIEEWVDFPIYSDQVVKDNRTFFQYRFGPDMLVEIIKGFPDTVEVVNRDIFWERREGLYDWLVRCLRRSGKSPLFGRLKSALLNVALGPIFFRRMPGDFKDCRSFGNAHIILKKKGVYNRSSDE